MLYFLSRKSCDAFFQPACFSAGNGVAIVVEFLNLFTFGPFFQV